MEELFKKASKARTIQELDVIIEENSDISAIVNEFQNKYPDIDLTVQNEEVDHLIAEGIRLSRNKCGLPISDLFYRHRLHGRKYAKI